ncbi:MULTISPECIES: competence protein CoiA family protein [unclassified Pantoea]|uniref:competence protein CoiA n=1 Tax=unclassified Pantoea TaxID=2630326 RepID=UPI002269F805|nr:MULTISPECIES: competence protein CoiA family protein [unclassified Pantoea]
MLCGKRVSDSEKVFAITSVREHAPFACITCGVELVLKKGQIKIHHFAHKPPHKCRRSEGESIEHMRCKLEIYNALLKCENVSDVQLEHDLGTAIADVYAVIDGSPVAIEIQRSKLTVNEIVRRTEEYTRLKVNVLWIALYSSRLTEDKFSPNAWEKWCHAAYYGRVYYWSEGLKLTPYHFGEYKLYVESSSYYDQSGQEVSHGGYEKFSKRYRTPIAGPVVNLARSFDRNFRKSWSKATIVIPDCRLYLDNKKKWW